MQGLSNTGKSINLIHHITKLKNKNYVIVHLHWPRSIPDKIQHLFPLKTLITQEIKVNSLTLLRSSHEKAAAKVKFNDECFPRRSGTRQDVYPHHFHQYCIEGSVQCTQDGKRNKKHADWQGRGKTVCILRWHDYWWQKFNEIYKSYQDRWASLTRLQSRNNTGTPETNFTSPSKYF